MLAYDFGKRQQQVHWMPEEVTVGRRLMERPEKLDEGERTVKPELIDFLLNQMLR